MSSNRYLDERRLEIQATAREFAMKEVFPLANELDPQKADIPRDFLRRMGEMGYFGIMIDTEHGGMGLGAFEYCLISEELSRAWMSTASIIARGNGMGTAVADPDRRRALLEKSARGEWIGAAALSEPNAGSDLANVQCRAELDGDEYVITGDKKWCGNAWAADFIQLLARTGDPPPGGRRSQGLETFLVEKEPDAFPAGLTGRPIDKIGYYGMTTWYLEFRGLRIPKENLLGAGRRSSPSDPAGSRGGRGRAFSATQRGLNVARVHTAARAIGLARGALEDSLAYAQEREQFERPIGSFQSIRFMLADMATEIEAARALMYQVAQQVDDGEPIEREAAMVKLFATEMAERVTHRGLQIHGGNGYTTERQVERYWRDARLTTIFEGTSEIQRRIISDRLLPKGRG
ncbi:MAG: acyl-CoA dehydrogenase family protein [Thermoanaerobaculia bacterium]|nr:acyl-CoA dehydrogenase family protein [Thermoanaerobaculia bacterium]